MTLFTTELIVRLITSLVASCAFAVVFKIAPRHLPYAAVSGALTYFVYHLVLYFNQTLLLAAFLSTVTAAVFAELYARIRRAPAMIILYSAVIPIVPGGSLYYWVQHLFSGDNVIASTYLGETIAVGLGMASGIVVVSLVFRTAFKAKPKANK